MNAEGEVAQAGHGGEGVDQAVGELEFGAAFGGPCRWAVILDDRWQGCGQVAGGSRRCPGLGVRALPEVKAVADLHGFMGRGDLTDEQWAVLEPLLPQGRKVGRPPVRPRRQLIDGIRDKLSVRYEATVLVAAINEWLRPALSHQS